ncbi:MAG TPA: hypothetical protein VME63_05105 [Dyella sp.]|uniref:hypothetical protein n=1 Tax=Dyella sp. TaxID=1869338 RepID=UPI002B780AA7|nr:hypothetical protein [Dyella sp.]HTV84758.1 hypothetical protein [Dyella sp.]
MDEVVLAVEVFAGGAVPVAGVVADGRAVKAGALADDVLLDGLAKGFALAMTVGLADTEMPWPVSVGGSEGGVLLKAGDTFWVIVVMD